VDFELTEEQRLLREFSRAMLTAACPPALVRAVADAGTDGDDALWQKAVELGWPSLAVAEDAGGAGQGVIELCLVAEEVGRAAAPGPFAESALVAAAAAGGGAPDDVVAGLLEGKHKGAVVDAAAPDLIHAAGSADWLLVLGADVRLAPAPATKRRTTIDLSRGWYAATGPLDGRVLDLDPHRWRDAMTVLTAADALGAGERLLEMTVAYTTVREQFGRPIGSFQAVKHKAADMLITLQGVRAATYRAAMAIDAGAPDASLWASVAKAHAAEGVSEVAGTALQLHGGIGFTWEHDLHLFLRRAKVDEAIWGNASSHHRRVAALLRQAG